MPRAFAYTPREEYLFTAAELDADSEETAPSLLTLMTGRHAVHRVAAYMRSETLVSIRVALDPDVHDDPVEVCLMADLSADADDWGSLVDIPGALYVPGSDAARGEVTFHSARRALAQAMRSRAVQELREGRLLDCGAVYDRYLYAAAEILACAYLTELIDDAVLTATSEELMHPKTGAPLFQVFHRPLLLTPGEDWEQTLPDGVIVLRTY